MKRSFRKWAPAQLKEIFRGERDVLSEHERTLLERLCSDDRIRFFWEWLKATEDQDETAVPGAALIFYACVRGLEFPGKPADMPPKEKSKYLSDVRKNAAALKRLLHGTRFDAEIDPSKKKSSGSMQALSGEILDYPFGALTLQLNEVIEWAKKPDRHDISGGPDWMLRQSGLPAKKLFLFFHLRAAFEDFDEKPTALFVCGRYQCRTRFR